MLEPIIQRFRNYHCLLIQDYYQRVLQEFGRTLGERGRKCLEREIYEPWAEGDWCVRYRMEKKIEISFLPFVEMRIYGEMIYDTPIIRRIGYDIDSKLLVLTSMKTMGPTLLVKDRSATGAEGVFEHEHNWRQGHDKAMAEYEYTGEMSIGGMTKLPAELADAE